MRKLSDEFTQTRLYREDANLRAIYARYMTDWTSLEGVTTTQLVFDVGYLVGVLVKVERRLDEVVDQVVTAEADTPEAWEGCEDEPEPD
jgi:hypothetical protein